MQAQFQVFSFNFSLQAAFFSGLLEALGFRL